MQVVKKYPEGTFSWIDLASTDAAGAKAFYTGLLQWEARDIPLPQGGVYTMLEQSGHAVAALSEMQPEQKAAGIPSYWSSYVTVADVDGMTAKAAELGGTVVAPAFDVMEEGRMSVIQDPTGGTVCLWQPKNHIGAALVNIPDTLCWNELSTKDPATASQFYTALFGWTASVDDSGYYLLKNGDRFAGGMMKMAESQGDMPPNWGIYIAVDDADATATRAKELGATLLMEPFDVPGTGRMAVVADPTGAVFSIIKMEQADPPPGY